MCILFTLPAVLLCGHLLLCAGILSVHVQYLSNTLARALALVALDVRASLFPYVCQPSTCEFVLSFANVCTISLPESDRARVLLRPRILPTAPYVASQARCMLKPGGKLLMVDCVRDVEASGRAAAGLASACSCPPLYSCACSLATCTRRTIIDVSSPYTTPPRTYTPAHATHTHIHVNGVCP